MKMKGRHLCIKLMAAVLCTGSLLLNTPAVYAASDEESTFSSKADSTSSSSGIVSFPDTKFIFDGIQDIKLNFELEGTIPEEGEISAEKGSVKVNNRDFTDYVLETTEKGISIQLPANKVNQYIIDLTDNEILVENFAIILKYESQEIKKFTVDSKQFEFTYMPYTVEIDPSVYDKSDITIRVSLSNRTCTIDKNSIIAELKKNNLVYRGQVSSSNEAFFISWDRDVLEAIGLDESREYPIDIYFTLSLQVEGQSQDHQFHYATKLGSKYTAYSGLKSRYTASPKEIEFNGTEDIVLSFELAGEGNNSGYSIKAAENSSDDLQIKINDETVSDYSMTAAENGVSLKIPKEIFLSGKYGLKPENNSISVDGDVLYLENNSGQRVSLRVDNEIFTFTYKPYTIEVSPEAFDGMKDMEITVALQEGYQFGNTSSDNGAEVTAELQNGGIVESFEGVIENDHATITLPANKLNSLAMQPDKEYPIAVSFGVKSKDGVSLVQVREARSLHTSPSYETETRYKITIPDNIGGEEDVKIYIYLPEQYEFITDSVSAEARSKALIQDYRGTISEKNAEIILPVDRLKYLPDGEYSVDVRFAFGDENAVIQEQKEYTLENNQSICSFDGTYTAHITGESFDGRKNIVLYFDLNLAEDVDFPADYVIKPGNYSSEIVKINGMPAAEKCTVEAVDKKGISLTIPKELLLSDGYLKSGENTISVSGVTFEIMNPNLTDEEPHYTFRIDDEIFTFENCLKSPSDPVIPGEAENPGTAQQSDNIPKSGDTAHLALWLALSVVSVFGMLGAFLLKKHQKNCVCSHR